VASAGTIVKAYSELAEMRFSVLGAARSGIAVAALLRAHRARVFVSDRAPAEKMAEAKKRLDALGVESEFGANSERALEAQTIVISPGVPSNAPLVEEAVRRGLAVVSEVEVASWFCRGQIVAITGTNGKTTTVTLLGRILEDAKLPVAVGGNIGTAFAEIAERVPANGTAVLEISSFQLDHIRSFRPRVAAILNITPDHLDRYGGSFERYIDAKCRIFDNQGSGDHLIYNADDTPTAEAVARRAPAGVNLHPFSLRRPENNGAFLRNGHLVVSAGGKETDVIALNEISIRGSHNHANAMAAALAAMILGVPTSSLRATLRNFKGVEHRLEFVRELDGVQYVNDSKGTNVDSVWYALQSFDRPIVLLLGGRDKGNDYTRLEELVRRNVHHIIAIGESAGTVQRAFAGIVPVEVCTEGMEQAVRTARAAARPGEVVLLSPACASFDWFANYEERGRVFKAMVMSLA
jgi:UDP-N-acetylmuramoylalanine--D-glutamate ligase